MKKAVKVVRYIIIVCLCFEIALWLVGYRPYSNDNYKIEAVPNNPYVGDADYGIALNEGDFSIELNDSIQFEVSHSASGQRVVPGGYDSSNENVHFYGCSFTYGYGVNDDETFSALLKKERDLYNVYNHGVVGFGTVQSWLQLQEEVLEKGDEVILCFSSEHLKRNTLSPQYRSDLKLGFENSSQNLEKKMEGARFPYLTDCSAVIEYLEWNQMYDNYLFREYSATVNLIQTLMNYYHEDKDLQVEIAECLINKMKMYCQDKGAGFTVLCLDESPETIAIEKNNPNINWVNVGFDFKSQKYTNLPYDSHPNSEGHQLISATILNALFREK